MLEEKYPSQDTTQKFEQKNISKVLMFSKHHKIANAVKTLDFVFPKK